MSEGGGSIPDLQLAEHGDGSCMTAVFNRAHTLSVGMVEQHVVGTTSGVHCAHTIDHCRDPDLLACNALSPSSKNRRAPSMRSAPSTGGLTSINTAMLPAITTLAPAWGTTPLGHVLGLDHRLYVEGRVTRGGTTHPSTAHWMADRVTVCCARAWEGRGGNDVAKFSVSANH